MSYRTILWYRGLLWNSFNKISFLWTMGQLTYKTNYLETAVNLSKTGLSIAVLLSIKACIKQSKVLQMNELYSLHSSNRPRLITRKIWLTMVSVFYKFHITIVNRYVAAQRLKMRIEMCGEWGLQSCLCGFCVAWYPYSCPKLSTCIYKLFFLRLLRKILPEDFHSILKIFRSKNAIVLES